MPQKKTNKYTALLLVFFGAICLSCADNDVDTTKGPYEGPWEVYEVKGLAKNTSIYGLYMFSSSSGWACSDEAILKYDNDDWRIVFDLTGRYARGCELRRIRFSSPTDGWAAGWEWQGGSCTAIVYHFDGSSWGDVSPVGASGFLDIFPLSPTDVWACGYDGIYHYDGSSWTLSAAVSQALGLWFTSAANGWCVTGYGGYLRWDGSSWRGVHSLGDMERRHAVCAPTPTTGWAGGGGATGVPGVGDPLYYYDAGWDIWKPYEDPSFDYNNAFYDIHFAAPDDGWAVGQGTYRYDGHKWARVPGPPGTACSVFTLGGDEVWVGLYRDRICKYDPDVERRVGP